MDRGFQHLADELLARREPCAVATVVATHGSSAAKPGARALVSRDGRNLRGWVGGGCAERLVCEQSVEAIQQCAPRLISVDLEDELFGAGMPCGGQMEVFIEPVLPPRRLCCSGEHACLPLLDELAARAGWELVHRTGSSEPDPDDYHLDVHSAPALKLGATTPAELAVAHLAAVLARTRCRTGRPLREVKQTIPPAPQNLRPLCDTPRLILIGASRLTEEVARLAAILSWPCRICATQADTPEPSTVAGPTTCVIVATQHRGDHLLLPGLLRLPFAYVGLVASQKRTRLVQDVLRSNGSTDGELARLYSPAGLDLGATTPFEIALSLAAELLACQHGCSGQPASPT